MIKYYVYDILNCDPFFIFRKLKGFSWTKRQSAKGKFKRIKSLWKSKAGHHDDEYVNFVLMPRV